MPQVSIPFRRLTEFTCEIQKDPNDSPDPVTFVVEGNSQQNGSARIIGTTKLAQTGKIKLLGVSQTELTHSGKLYVRAMFKGAYVGAGSNPFSVCAHPAAVKNGPECVAHYSDEEGLRVGMYTSIGVVSDSGSTADLSEVEDQEHVSLGQDQSKLLKHYVTQPEIGKI